MLTHEEEKSVKTLSDVMTRVSSPSSRLFEARLRLLVKAKALADWTHKFDGSLTPRG